MKGALCKGWNINVSQTKRQMRIGNSSKTKSVSYPENSTAFTIRTVKKQRMPNAACVMNEGLCSTLCLNMQTTSSSVLGGSFHFLHLVLGLRAFPWKHGSGFRNRKTQIPRFCGNRTPWVAFFAAQGLSQSCVWCTQHSSTGARFQCQAYQYSIRAREFVQFWIGKHLPREHLLSALCQTAGFPIMEETDNVRAFVF